MRTALSIHLARWYIASAVVLFVLFSSVAIALYPGGDDWNPRTIGYEFWRNTLSDLGKEITKSGQVHRGAALFDAALAILASAFVSLWLAAPRLLPSRPLRRIVTALGLLSVVGMVGVALTPGDRYPTGHTITIGIGAVPGLAAFILFSLGVTAAAKHSHEPPATAKRSPIPAATLYAIMCWLTLAVAMVHFGQYIATFWLGWTWQPWFPATQKVATLLTLAWMLWTARRTNWCPQKRIRKQIYDLTLDDLDKFPAWEFALDEESLEGQDEATVRPYEGVLDPSKEMFIVHASFTLADGSKMRGYLTPTVQSDESIGTRHPIIITPTGQVGFWCGVICPTPDQLAQSYRSLGREASRVFPLHFVSLVELIGGPIYGVISGFMVLENFETRKIKTLR